MKNQLLLVTTSALLFISIQATSFAETPNNAMSNTSSQMPMQGNMRMMHGNQGQMGMMNGDHNCMGMKRGQNHMGMMKGQNHNGMMNGGCMNMSMQRHRFVMQNGISQEYQAKINPIQTATSDILSTGKSLYDSNCSSCHGQSGIGNGPAGVNLNPRPANIAAFSKMPMASDAYLNWTISEGGAPISSPMPVFKSQLKEQQIWQIITYLRTL